MNKFKPRKFYFETSASNTELKQPYIFQARDNRGGVNLFVKNDLDQVVFITWFSAKANYGRDMEKKFKINYTELFAGIE